MNELNKIEEAIRKMIEVTEAIAEAQGHDLDVTFSVDYWESSTESYDWSTSNC